MHFLHKSFPGTSDKISRCAKFHSSSCLISSLPSGLLVLLTENQLSKLSSSSSSPGFLAPSRPNGWKWCFKPLNRLCYTGLEHSESQRISKLNHWFEEKKNTIFLNGWILPIAGVASGRVYACSLRTAGLFELEPVFINRVSFYLTKVSKGVWG